MPNLRKGMAMIIEPKKIVVFAVQWEGLECGGVAGVYSTRQLAQLAIDKLDDDWYSHEIFEVVLDGELGLSRWDYDGTL